MIVGFVGSGNMAAAMARGLKGTVEGMLFSDSGSGRAEAIADEAGSVAIAANSALAEQADVVVLAVKSAMLDEVAGELGRAETIVSLLGGTSLDRVREALPGPNVVRVMPNLGVEVRQGVLCLAG